MECLNKIKKLKNVVVQSETSNVRVSSDTLDTREILDLLKFRICLCIHLDFFFIFDKENAKI